MIGTGVRFGSILNWPARGDISVRCPRCAKEAVFTSPYDYLQGEAAETAAQDARLTGVQWSRGFAVERFPETFPWRDPNNPYVHVARGQVWGVVSCGSCTYRSKHLLAWPSDAFYRVELPPGTLWAYTRRHLVQIRAWVAGGKAAGPFGKVFLPKDFLLKRHRRRVLREVDALLLGHG